MFFSCYMYHKVRAVLLAQYMEACNLIWSRETSIMSYLKKLHTVINEEIIWRICTVIPSWHKTLKSTLTCSLDAVKPDVLLHQYLHYNVTMQLCFRREEVSRFNKSVTVANGIEQTVNWYWNIVLQHCGVPNIKTCSLVINKNELITH